MAKDKSIYTCNECGASSPKWLGKCPGCGAWNTLIESVAEPAGAGKNRFQSLARVQPVATLSQIEASDVERQPTGIAELDTILTGGLDRGTSTLLMGAAGSGKSSLATQVALAGLHDLETARAHVGALTQPGSSRPHTVRISFSLA